MKYGLQQADIDAIQRVFSNYPQIERVVLYGSRALGTQHSGSDIDLTLFGHGLTLKIQLAIENELDDLLLPYKVDLSIHADIENTDLRNHIERVGVNFYSL